LQELESLLAEKELASEIDADRISDLQKEVQINATTIEELKSALDSSKSLASKESAEAQEKMRHLMSDNEKIRELIKRQSETKQEAASEM